MVSDLDKPDIFVRSTTAEKVYEALLDELLAGRFERNEKLQERELAEYFQVSRTPLREALSRLQHDGLVVSIPYRGVFVRDYTQEEVEAILEFRIELEAFAARLAALRHTNEEMQKIQETVVRFGQAIGREDKTYLTRTNARFHMLIAGAAHNPWLYQTLERLQVHYSLLRSPALSDPQRVQEVKREHWNLVGAIADRGPDLAEQLMRQHLDAAREFLLSYYLSHNSNDGHEWA